MSEAATVTAMPAVAAPIGTAVPFTERDAFELSLRKAKVYSASTLVPEMYRENIPNCLIALNMARRIKADELMVMQNLYIVSGKPGWSAQFLIATFNQCGRFSAMRFEWTGDANNKAAWACRARAAERDTGEQIIGAWVTWKMAEAEGWVSKKGSKWLTMPEQMFMYRAGAYLVRAYAPELAMGLSTLEELRDVIDVELEPQPSKTDAVLAALRAKSAPAPAIDQETASIPAANDPGAAPGEPELPPAQVPPDRPAMPYAAVREQLDQGFQSGNLEQLDQAATNIELVANPKQARELGQYYRELRGKLQA